MNGPLIPEYSPFPYENPLFRTSNIPFIYVFSKPVRLDHFTGRNGAKKLGNSLRKGLN